MGGFNDAVALPVLVRNVHSQTITPLRSSEQLQNLAHAFGGWLLHLVQVSTSNVVRFVVSSFGRC
jgi:hypothetical protein